MSGSQKWPVTPPGLAFVSRKCRGLLNVHNTSDLAAVLGLEPSHRASPLPELLRRLRSTACSACAASPSCGRGPERRFRRHAFAPDALDWRWPVGRARSGVHIPIQRARQFRFTPSSQEGPRAAASARHCRDSVQRGARRRFGRAVPARPSASPTWATATAHGAGTLGAVDWASPALASPRLRRFCRRRWNSLGAR